jgi:hypothetical protein
MPFACAAAIAFLTAAFVGIVNGLLGSHRSVSESCFRPSPLRVG